MYSSAGFGGGSSYLALLSLFMTDFGVIKTAALFCNLMVVGNSSYLFYRGGFFDRRKFIPLALCSVPAAFWGATIQVRQEVFFILLGSVLALSGLMLIMQLCVRPSDKESRLSDSLHLNVLLGGTTGFLSGLVGIGGGVLLSPILNLLHWDRARKIAALASFFILVNSLAGLLGQAVSGAFSFNAGLLTPLLASVFLGGQAGTRLSLKILPPQFLKGLTGVLVVYIGVKLVLKHTNGIDI